MPFEALDTRKKAVVAMRLVHVGLDLEDEPAEGGVEPPPPSVSSFGRGGGSRRRRREGVGRGIRQRRTEEHRVVMPARNVSSSYSNRRPRADRVPRCPARRGRPLPPSRSGLTIPRERSSSRVQSSEADEVAAALVEHTLEFAVAADRPGNRRRGEAELLSMSSSSSRWRPGRSHLLMKDRIDLRSRRPRTA